MPSQPKPLRDVVALDLCLLFVGINPGLRSAEIGHHFGGRTNPFWRLLHASKLVPELLEPEADRRLLEHRLGVTNLCRRPSRGADELTREERAQGALALRRKVARLRPQAVALVGITLYREVFPRGTTGGPGAKPETLAGAAVFVLPNPSGLNASFPGFQHKLVWFERLRDWLAEIAPGCARREERGRSPETMGETALPTTRPNARARARRRR